MENYTLTLLPILSTSRPDDFTGGQESGAWHEMVASVVEATQELYGYTKAQAPWLGYLARHRENGEVVGTCAFKSNPLHGIVEVAYFTFPDHEGQGYGTEMLAHLIDITAQNPDVAGIVAHSLPERGAATRILEKQGFTHVAEIEDPDDGTIWRWARPTPAQTAKAGAPAQD